MAEEANRDIQASSDFEVFKLGDINAMYNDQSWSADVPIVFDGRWSFLPSTCHRHSSRATRSCKVEANVVTSQTHVQWVG